jgi:hypothetical protein
MIPLQTMLLLGLFKNDEDDSNDTLKEGEERLGYIHKRSGIYYLSIVILALLLIAIMIGLCFYAGVILK